jgi:hypothetical protein
MDETDPDEAPPPPRAPSMAFSWASVGFILGALFVLALPPHRTPPAPSPAPAAPEPAPVRRIAPKLSTIEAVFEEWQQYAVWDGDTTEVALFDAQTKAFTDTYEVLRVDGRFYFRTIAQLTRVPLTHGVPDNSPLEFTETAEQRAEWLRTVDAENWKDIQKSIREPSR